MDLFVIATPGLMKPPLFARSNIRSLDSFLNPKPFCILTGEGMKTSPAFSVGS